MSKDICIFKRVEKKYLITKQQKDQLLGKIGAFLVPDSHGKSTIRSLYLDTPDFLIIRNSIDAKAYKEKLRLRSYGTPSASSQVFLELKKKYQGVVYKRRVSMSLEDAEIYFDIGLKPVQTQIMSEIDYAMSFYGHPVPQMMIAYEREAFFVNRMPDMRLTFDSEIRYRNHHLRLELGTDGKTIIPNDTFLLEIKTTGAMPIWLADALDVCHIFPSSFSKYATAYQISHMFHHQKKGDNNVSCI